ncbi:MAG: glycosyltransferase [Candidatus Aenigmarchaeota archaeon]|nr:glycosyltransferase [Candidatus Aenigmarchaeota archaeon]
MRPKVSILIIARNEEHNIPKLFKSLKRLRYPRDSYEIVLIDDKSTDNTGKVAKSFGARVVRNENWAGRGRARNIALKNAKYDHVAWIDADCEIVNENWLNDMIPYLKGKVVGVAGTHVFPSHGNSVQKAIWFLPGMHMETDKPKEFSRAPTTSSLFLKKPLIDVGMFNEKLVTGEDLEICMRLRKNGYKFMLIPSAKIIIGYRKTAFRYMEQQIEYGSEGAKILAKYHGRGKILLSIPVLILLFAAAYLFPLLIPVYLASLFLLHFTLLGPEIAVRTWIRSLKAGGANVCLANFCLTFLRNISIICGFLRGILRT